MAGLMVVSTHQRAAAWLVGAGYALLLTAWAAAAAPFTVPDEMAHYIRVLGVSTDDVVGEPRTYPADASDPGARVRREWVNATSRSIEIPAGLSGLALNCMALDASIPAACLNEPKRPPYPVQHHELTPMGTYPPAPYLLPGAVVRLGTTPITALAWARAMAALTSGVLLALTALALWHPRHGPGSLIGPLLAVTPMGLYLGASINASGLEVIATVTFTALLLRLSRDADEDAPSEDDSSGAFWLAAGAVGAAVVASRSIGLVWVAGIITLWLLWTGPVATFRLVRRRARHAVMAGALLLAGVVANLAWQVAYEPTPPVGLDGARAVLETGWDQLDAVMTEAIGNFGPLDTPLPAWLEITWRALVVVVVLAALVWSRGVRRRVAILAALAGVIAGPLVFWAVSYRHTGFGLQGRHFLALLAVLPLFAGEAASRFAPRRLVGIATGVLALLIAAFHGVAWWWVARRYAVGFDGPLWFPSDPAWAPVGGWYVWAALAAAGCIALSAGGITAGRAAFRRPSR